ncbi:hypothetical protein [Nostoc sp.]|uniref:hypothetical protein n=1 Tax=Nostoc sp. TaxID=1180 RepID=UPI002FFB406C
MTIQKATHKICKTVQKTSFRKSVKQLFDDLELNGSIVHLNSFAVALNRQFFGYAFAHQEVCKQGYSLLPPEGIDILTKAHKLLLETTEGICRLDDILPKAQAAISPYSDCQVDLSNLLVLPEVDDSGTLHKALEELKQNFNKHPALGILSDCISHLNGLDNFEDKQFVEIVLNFRRKIINQGFSEVDDDLRRELFNRKDLTQLYRARLVRSLIVLRDSISSISQFIYQAFRYEKPIILNRDNVFRHEGMNRNWFGDTTFLRVQPIGKEAYLWPGDFVIVSLGLENLVEDGFYRVEKIDNLDSSDLGPSTRFSLRKIDENMVCYPQLLSD